MYFLQIVRPLQLHCAVGKTHLGGFGEGFLVTNYVVHENYDTTTMPYSNNIGLLRLPMDPVALGEYQQLWNMLPKPCVTPYYSQTVLLLWKLTIFLNEIIS